MKNRKGFVLSTYVYILLVFFLLLLGTMLVVLNNTKLLSNKLKDKTQETSGLTDSDYSFILLGNKEEITRINEEYVDKGVKAQTTKGVDLTENVITENNVNINEIGDYEINYRVTYNGVTKKLTRIVHVVDNIGVNYLNSLYQYRNDENGLIVDNTEDENLRYAGSNDDVKNYVEFGNNGELWRIIGVFDVASEEGGTPVPRIKLVREDFLIDEASWDSSAETVNFGNGINQWGKTTYLDGSEYEGADLMRLLNGYYLRKENECLYCNDAKQGECTQVCDFEQLRESSINMIDKVVWDLGGLDNHDSMSSKYAYDKERGDGVGTTANINYTTKWEGEIGLIYPSDYGYAGQCENIRDNACGTESNWLFNEQNYWTITPKTGVVSESRLVSSYGFLAYDRSTLLRTAIRPSVYLNPNVKITGGTGTETDPYQLTM